MAVQVNPITQSLPATTAIQDPATRRFAQAVEDALRALRSEEGAVESLKKAADAMNGAIAGGTPPSIAQWLFSSELYQKLTTEIARVDVEAKQDLLDEALARQTAIDEINATLGTIQSTAAYDPLVTYAVGDMVTYDGKLYQAILETTGNPPTNTAYWKKVGDYATLGDVVAAHTLEINDLESRVTADEGNLTAEIASRQALATQVRGSYTGTDVNLVSQGLIYSERVARSTADSTEVAKRESLSAKILGTTDPDGLTLNTLSEGLIFDERQARVNGDGANASSITALRAQVGVTEAGALTTGLILDEKNVRASNDLAIVSAVNTALAQITGVSTSISQSGENLIANWTAAQATKWSQIESEVLTSGGQTIRAALLQESQTRANADGSLGAQWTLKTDINGYISGFGFASTANNAAPTSEFIIRADKFAVVMPGYGEHVPFAIGDFGPAMFGDGGFSVPVSRLVNQAAQPTSFLETFESGSVAQWTNHSGSGELSVVSVVDSLTGGKVLRIGNNSGNDQAWLIHKQNIPFDHSALYRIKFRVRRTAGTGVVWLGVAGIAADGVTFVNIVGANDPSNQHYVAATNQNPGSAWTEYVGYVKGTAAFGQTGTNPSITAPLKLHQSVKYIRPLILANHQDATGTTEVDYCSIELMTDTMNWDGVSGTGKDALVTTASTALTNANAAQAAANTANAALADIAADNKLTAVEKQSAANEWGIINRERASIQAQASALGISTELGDYNYTYAVLNDYITPLLSDLQSTSAIDGVTFRDKWSYFYEYRQRLLNKMAAVAATKADWANVTGSGKPENGATVGANSSNLKAGVGVNMIFNGDLSDGLAGVAHVYNSGGVGATLGWNLPGYIVAGEGTGYVVKPSGPADSSLFDARFQNGPNKLAVTPGARYEVYAWLNTHRCEAAVNVHWYDANGEYIGEVQAPYVFKQSGVQSTADMVQSFQFVTAPANARQADVRIRARTLGTSPYCFFSRVFFGAAGAGQTEPSPWSPGRGISQITSSNVTTYIANAAIGNAQIGGDIWSSNFVAGSAGWRIYRSGSAEFRNVTARGDIEASSLKANTAMVGTANIGDLTVTTAKIKDNAVTIPVSAYTAGMITIPNSWTTVQSVVCDPEGGSVSLVCSAMVVVDSEVYSTTEARILSPSGAQVAYASVSHNYVNAVAAISLTGRSTQSGTYSLQILNSKSSVKVSHRSLIAIGSKK